MKNKILIVDDETDICDLIELNLLSNGFDSVKSVHDGKQALEAAMEWKPDLILLDLMLPLVDGFEVCSKLRENPETKHIPVIMLTAKSSELDIVKGLELGANDYITKPFSNKILIARIKAQLRTAETINIIEYKNLVINLDEHTVKLCGMNLDLTYSEFEIISAFAKHPGRVYTRAELISMLRGNDGFDIAERAIDVQIVNLRRKLGKSGNYIETVRGIGYRFGGV